MWMEAAAADLEKKFPPNIFVEFFKEYKVLMFCVDSTYFQK